MDIEINERKENELLDRTEVRFTLSHPGEKTPERQAVREQLAAKLGTSIGLVVVDRLHTPFGRHETSGYAKAYKSLDQLRAVEPQHLLVRNGLAETEEA